MGRSFKQLTLRLRNEEDGAITVDWVVLTAAIIGLAVTIMPAITGSTTNLAGKISTNVGSMSIYTTFNY